jgi:hypothetical protein
MNISAVSNMSSYIINKATAMTVDKVQSQIQTAVLKQALDMQKTEGEALVRMIEDGVGGQLDVRV